MNQSLFQFNDDEEEEAEDNDVPGEAVALSVSAAVQLINDQLFKIAGPQLMIEGEVAEYGVSQGKWVRFTLKDVNDGALLKCFMTIYQLHVDIENGDRIIVEATPKIYPKYGQFTLNINKIEPVGEGALAKKLAALKKQLDSEGLFDESRKREIPLYPGRIGIVTSRDAAAFTDFVRILSNRWGDVDIDLAHVRVQGVNAPPEIVMAINYFNELQGVDRPDVLVLTRGGGSLEDLMAFNDEA
ncbi:exodeoxyribonuclease VII large subunit, partial [Candidatus Uhrbacteria bacterium]|nr:exodeoxyribonuclease VII large subunit [Candidatus Uhrbacteria bacterium]